ncbi:diguanylate cyclase [Legionella londiniensis]|uniref:diguanylate cyclase n=1 Tax=Legionella londiniensis TaxID=45068 RepID=A0A0W0VMF5_9GAMM|nr:diguanylate cyclase [Legionella londiniensis]KTD21244.1 sensor histidine kinase [Legionella londiniensis]STX93270.1 sensor histidine kinase [Legionella londiniensis]
MKKDILKIASQEKTIAPAFKINKSFLNTIFFFALSALLLISFFSYYQVKSLIDVNNRVIHAHKVIQSVNASLFELADLESHYRGFLISGQTQLLEEMDEIKKNLNQNLQKLTQLTKDNPEQNQRVLKFAATIKTRLQILSRITPLKIHEIQSTKEGADLFNRSQNLSNLAKNLGEEIKSIESALLNYRHQKLISEAEGTSLAIIVGNSLSILALIVAFALANVELTNRKKTELGYMQAQEQLRKVLEASSDMIAAFDEGLKFIIFNDSYHKEFKLLFGTSISAGMSIEAALAKVPESRKELVHEWKESLRSNTTSKILEVDVNHQTKTYELTSSLLQGLESAQGAVQNIRDITENIREHMELQQSYQNLSSSMRALEEKNKQISFLVEMSDIMLACNTQNEFIRAMNSFTKKLLEFASGFLFIMHSSKNALEKIVIWGEPNEQLDSFSPDLCWGIRLGRMHQVDESATTLVCPHTKTNHKDVYHLCIPLMAQNNIYGLLYLETSKESPPFHDENQRLLITAFSELTALALANIRLRENLRFQSIHDALTGLYNRRYLEEFLNQQIGQAKRENQQFALLMLDLDHFKSINDAYGHEAGDEVLKEIGEVFRNEMRATDLACRYGGEEFVVFIHNINTENAKNIAENLRLKIYHLNIKHNDQQIGPITISIGIAIFPNNGQTVGELLGAADGALYQAKKKGRNQVVLYGSPEQAR